MIEFEMITFQQLLEIQSQIYPKVKPLVNMFHWSNRFILASKSVWKVCYTTGVWVPCPSYVKRTRESGLVLNQHFVRAKSFYPCPKHLFLWPRRFLSRPGVPHHPYTGPLCSHTLRVFPHWALVVTRANWASFSAVRYPEVIRVGLVVTSPAFFCPPEGES